MTKLIAAFMIIVVVLYGGWELFLYWEKVKNEDETKQKQEAAAMVMGTNCRACRISSRRRCRPRGSRVRRG